MKILKIATVTAALLMTAGCTQVNTQDNIQIAGILNTGVENAGNVQDSKLAVMKTSNVITGSKVSVQGYLDYSGIAEKYYEDALAEDLLVIINVLERVANVENNSIEYTVVYDEKEETVQEALGYPAEENLTKEMLEGKETK